MAHKQCQCMQSSRSGACYSALRHCSTPIPRPPVDLGLRNCVPRGCLGVHDTQHCRSLPPSPSFSLLDLTRAHPWTLPTVHHGLAHFKPPRPSLSPGFEPPISRAPLGHPLSPLRALLLPPRPGRHRRAPGPTQAPIASPLPLNAREDTQGNKDPPPRTRPSSPCLPCPSRVSPEHRPPWPWPHSPSSSVGHADMGERARRSPSSSPVRRAPVAASLVARDELGLAPSIPTAWEAALGRRRPAGGPATPPVSLCLRV